MSDNTPLAPPVAGSLIRFRALGSLDLHDARGGELRALLVQPKRLALFTYLICSNPPRLHRRDSLLALFWPESTEEDARRSLRQALHFLRQTLGRDLLAIRGGDEVGLDFAAIWCDVREFDRALDAGRNEEALDLYRGHLLEGFHAAGVAPEFDQWLEGERSRLRARAVRAATAMADEAERAGDHALAAQRLRHVLQLEPGAESALRRLMTLLDASGDRLGAIRAYEEVARRLAAELDEEPSAETVALAERVRRGTAPRMRHAVPPALTVSAPPATPTASAAGDDAVPPRRFPRSRTLQNALAVFAVAVVVAAVGGVAVLRQFGIGPAASRVAAGKLDERAKLLVADFTVPGADSALGRVVAEAVRAGLGDSKAVRVLSTGTVSDALQRMRRPAGARVDGDVAREIAQREGVAAIVMGDVATLGGAYLLTVRVVDVAKQDALVTAQATAKGPDDLIPAIDRATRALRGKMGESLKSVRAGKALSRMTTGSLDALREYTASYGPFERGDWTTAAAHLERAIALDSNFAGAYVRLWKTYAYAGAESRRRPAVLARAYALRDRVPERERLEVIAAYHGAPASPGYDRARAQAAVESLLAMSPSSALWMQLGNLHRSRGDLTRAESAYRRAVAAEPGAAMMNSLLARNLAHQQRWLAVDSVLTTMRAKGMGDYPFLPSLRIQAAYMRGRLDSAVMLAREAASSPRPQIALTGRRTLRALDLLHGRLAAAQRVARDQRNPTEDLTVRPRTGDERAPLLHALDLAMEDLWVRQDSTRVVRRLAAALRSWPVEQLSLDDRPYLRLARLYALAGDASEAKRWLARYDAEVTDAGVRRQDGPARAAALAWVAAAERRWEDALRETEAASRDVDGGPRVTEVGANFARGFIHAAAGHTDAAIDSFERFLAEPYDYRLTEADDIYLPIALEKLGALYEAKGNTAKALERYERFAALWKDADPELQPRVAEARRRIARLRPRSG